MTSQSKRQEKGFFNQFDFVLGLSRCFSVTNDRLLRVESNRMMTDDQEQQAVYKTTYTGERQKDWCKFLNTFETWELVV